MTELLVFPGRPKQGKRQRFTYLIRAEPEWLHSLTHKSYLGKSGPTWWAMPTKWLWEPTYTQLSAAELGALIRIICMFMRDRDSYNSGELLTDRKELRMHGISPHVFCEISKNFMHVEISLVTESGEIKNLKTGFYDDMT